MLAVFTIAISSVWRRTLALPQYRCIASWFHNCNHQIALLPLINSTRVSCNCHKSHREIPLGYVNKCGFPPPDGVLGENELSIQRKCTRFPMSDSLLLLAYFAQLQSYSSFSDVLVFAGISLLEQFWGFWTPKSQFQHFGYPKGTSLRQTTSFKLSHVKIRCELWSVGELTKQEE